MTEETVAVYSLSAIRKKSKEFPCRPNCGLCCCCIYLPRELWLSYGHLAERKILGIETNADGDVKPHTEDKHCALLSLDARCLCYADRPLICIAYGVVPELPCVYFDIDGRYRPIDEQKQVYEECANTVDRVNKECQR
jgi:Fe-S-cluster containining protein